MDTNGGNILIVDDKPNNLDVLLITLSHHGYTAKAARSGKEALKLLETSPFDLILLDIMMPEVDGYTVCQQIKLNDQTQDIPVIFMSSLMEMVDKLRGFEAGAVDYLTKPLELEEVLARANAHIMLYRQRKEIERLLVEQRAAKAAEQQQRLMVNALLDIGMALNSTLDLSEVLARILLNVGLVVHHDLALLILLDSGWASITSLLAATGELSTHRLAVDNLMGIEHLLATRQPVIIDNLLIDTGWNRLTELFSAQSLLGVPILSDETIIGILVLLKYEPASYELELAGHLQAFAIQAAIAIKNAQLYQQSKALAVIEERQRLARELHDSVTQTLYSANNIAQALPRIMYKEMDHMEQYLGELAQLTQGAMAEMRTLLMELRPESLLQSDLNTLVAQLCSALAGKTHLDVTFNPSALVRLPADVHITFYRVAQEALNNVYKHAQATRVAVTLAIVGETFQLTVEDNGVGFGVSALTPDHFGIQFMNERAASIGATLEATSRLGHGTQIRLKGSLT